TCCGRRSWRWQRTEARSDTLRFLMSLARRSLLAAVYLCCAGATHVGAQPPDPSTAPAQPTFRAETTLVEVAAIVVDRSGTPVLDLSANDFEVFEDGQQRPLVSFRQVVSAAAHQTAQV